MHGCTITSGKFFQEEHVLYFASYTTLKKGIWSKGRLCLVIDMVDGWLEKGLTNNDPKISVHEKVPVILYCMRGLLKYVLIFHTHSYTFANNSGSSKRYLTPRKNVS